MENPEGGPRSIAIWLESLCSSTKAQTASESEARQAKDKAILALLGKLSLHYWRPDFTPGQAKQLYADYVEDLRDFPLTEVLSAIQTYRRGNAQFFPTSGQLVQIIRTVPSWDIRTATEHGNLLRQESAKELAEIVRKTEAKNLPMLPER